MFSWCTYQVVVVHWRVLWERQATHIERRQRSAGWQRAFCSDFSGAYL
jgi:hypothetical protein